MKLQFCLATLLLLCFIPAEGGCKRKETKFKNCLAIGYQPKHYKSCVTEDVDISTEDKRRCRRIERRLEKKCLSFTCTTSTRPAVLGGISEVEITDDIRKLADMAVQEFKNRALKSGNFNNDMSVIQGDVTEAMMQIVAGQKYFITMELGITNKMNCKQASEGQIVSKNECNDETNIGTYQFILVHTAWQKPQISFLEFHDVSGSELKDLYWTEN